MTKVSPSCLNHGITMSNMEFLGMDMLEANRGKCIVAPALNWLWATTYEAEDFGYTQSKAEADGYKHELDVAIAGLREMHRRGVVVLPGG